MPVVRISKETFDASRLGDAESLLEQSEAALRQLLQALPGLLHYYVAIDRDAGQLTNVSVWENVAAAHQMDTLQPMLAQRPIVEAAGVTFETITNHETPWTITP